MSTTTSLERNLKPSWVFAMALGSAVGWGAFILPYDWATTGGIAGTFIGFAIGGTMITAIAITYGYIVSKLPVAGGGVAYALSSLGRTHGFIAGWALTLGYSGIVALNASAVTLVFRVTLPGLMQRVKLYSVAGWNIYLPEVLIASAFIIIFALINIRGAKFSGKFQFYAVVLLLAAVALIFTSSVYFLITARPALPSAFPEGVSPFTAIATIVAFAPWAYVGFDSVPQLAGEFNFSPKKALSLLLWGVGTATAIYLVMMVSVTIAVSDKYALYENDPWPTATAIADMMGTVGFVLMVLAVSAGVLTGLNGFYASASRVLLTMGKSSMIPPVFGKLHPRYSTPVASLIFIAVVCMVTPWFGRSALLWIVDMTSVGIAVAYFYTCYCAYQIASKGNAFGMQKPTEPSKKHKITALLGCIFSIVFLALLLLPGSPGQLSGPSYIALVFWVVLGIVFYLIRRKAYLQTSDQEILEAVFTD